MTPKSHLFDLIQALSLPEKRYCSNYLKRHVKGKANRMHALFTLIDNQDSFDETALQTAFAKKFPSTKFVSTKHYLYKILLRALEAFHHDRSITQRLHSLLAQIDLLHQKGLHAQCLDLVKKGLKLAGKVDAHGLLLEFNRRKRRLIRSRIHPKLPANLQQIAAEEAESLHSLQEENAIQDLHDALYVHLQMYRRRAPDDPVRNAFDDHPLLQTANPPRSFFGKTGYFLSRSLHARLKQDLEATFQAHAALVALWDAHPEQVEADPGRYARILAAWLNSAYISGKSED
ncbi:MAG: hypothetical protein AAF570_13550, partial [Bacteroidota bacterium]